MTCTCGYVSTEETWVYRDGEMVRELIDLPWSHAEDCPEFGPRFEGHLNRDCGDHRTTGFRAWCHDCSEWCYPSLPCARCERPMLIARLLEQLMAAESMVMSLRNSLEQAGHLPRPEGQ